MKPLEGDQTSRSQSCHVDICIPAVPSKPNDLQNTQPTALFLTSFRRPTKESTCPTWRPHSFWKMCKKHNQLGDIWLVLHNKVYDVTKYLQDHPGGDAILMEVAGTDATEGFEEVGHSLEANEELYIGELAEEHHSELVEVFRPTFEKVSQQAAVAVSKATSKNSSHPPRRTRSWIGRGCRRHHSDKTRPPDHCNPPHRACSHPQLNITSPQLFQLLILDRLLLCQCHRGIALHRIVPLGMVQVRRPGRVHTLGCSPPRQFNTNPPSRRKARPDTNNRCTTLGQSRRSFIRGS